VARGHAPVSRHGSLETGRAESRWTSDRTDGGTDRERGLFRGERNDHELPRNTINKAWRRARSKVFIPQVLGSPLAATPYDLRHAAVSTWLNGGVPAADVAAWAGHSVEVLLKIYAKCLDGGSQLLRQRVQRALGHGPA
jgi:integrase